MSVIRFVVTAYLIVIAAGLCLGVLMAITTS